MLNIRVNNCKWLLIKKYLTYANQIINKNKYYDHFLNDMKTEKKALKTFPQKFSTFQIFRNCGFFSSKCPNKKAEYSLRNCGKYIHFLKYKDT